MRVVEVVAVVVVVVVVNAGSISLLFDVCRRCCCPTLSRLSPTLRMFLLKQDTLYFDAQRIKIRMG